LTKTNDPNNRDFPVPRADRSGLQRSRQVWSWALYDWGSSAFATTVMAGFFPVFFKQFWSVGVDPSLSTLRLGITSSVASLTVAVLAPVLGAIADGAAARRKFLLWMAGLGVVMTATLYQVPQGGWPAAAVIYALGIVGFSGANVFYDALLVSVAPRDRADYVSALGFAAGYLGGGLLFAINVAMSLYPSVFGLSGTGQAVRVSFVMVAAWWTVFTIPLALYVGEAGTAEKNEAHTGVTARIREGLRELADTLGHVRQLRMVFLFLLAYWLYIDGVHTIVRMAVDYGLNLGFPSNSLVAALLITQFVGFPASLAFGKLGERFGPKTGILIGISVYAGVTLWGYWMRSVWEFYVMAAVIGLVQGGVQSLSRSFYARMIPANRSAQFFGFYNTLGRFAAVLGPVIMGGVSYATGNPRLSVVAIISLFLAGGVLLLKVKPVSA
jgi:UMF1 family MFS transporter